MSNRRYYHGMNPHYKRVDLDCRFKVAAADTGGLGITGLKGPGIANVYMHTSQTPAAGNPNPQSGVIIVQLQDNFNAYFTGASQISAPNSGSNVNVDASDAALTVGHVYTITVLGTSTAADWLALGVPNGITPAVGVPFVALATGAGTGTGKVQAPAAAGAGALYPIQLIGDVQTAISSLAPSVIGSAGGSQIILGCYGATSSSVTTGILAAPPDGTIISLQFQLSNSYLTVQGE